MRMAAAAALAALAAAAALAAGMAVIDGSAEAQVTPFPSREKVVSVTGTATASAEPDLLTVTLGVETEDKTASGALGSNSESMAQVVSAVRSMGIPEEDIGTERLDIYPVYDYDGEARLAGYGVTNMIAIRTDRLDLAPAIVDSAVGAGANRVDGLQFSLGPGTEKALQDSLLAEAVLDARSQAEKALEPLGHGIVGVKAVYLSGPEGQPAPSYERLMYADSASAPIFSSDQSVSVSATVVFLIGPV